MSMMIEVNNLHKEYRQIKTDDKGVLSKIGIKRKYEIKKALYNISFSVEEGEMVGYLGLNGAGKSTTVKILSGILAPTKGEVRVLGMDPMKDRKKCTYYTATLFGQKNQLWWDLSVWDSIELAKYMYGMNASTFNENYKYIDKYLEVSEIKDIAVRQLSLGQKMRANLCFSLLHDPKILFLDEPTIGLDLLTKQQIQDCITKMNQTRGTSLILTTHDVSDIESLCKRTILIDGGKIVFDDSLDKMKKFFSGEKGIIIIFDESEGSDKIMEFFLCQEIEFTIIKDNEYLLNVPQKDFMRSKLFETLNKTFLVVSIALIDENLQMILTKIYKSLEGKMRG